jgi:hypothetical protein
VENASVDLIYLDSPFKSQTTCNVLFKEKSGEAKQAIAQVKSGQVGVSRVTNLKDAEKALKLSS